MAGSADSNIEADKKWGSTRNLTEEPKKFKYEIELCRMNAMKAGPKTMEESDIPRMIRTVKTTAVLKFNSFPRLLLIISFMSDLVNLFWFLI